MLDAICASVVMLSCAPNTLVAAALNAGPRIGLDGTPEAAAPAPDYVLPAWEIVAFQVLVNRSNRWLGDEREDYKISLSSIRRNLDSGWGTDKDPFETNQLGHPYQGAMYHGFARSAGLDYWPSLGYTFAGSALWEIAGENTHPSRNDQVASGVGGSFLGEALYRMSSLVLEKSGAGLSPFWRGAIAAAIDPAAGFNRWAFPERFGRSVFSSRDAAYYGRLQLGYSGSIKRDLGTSTRDIERNEAQVHFALDYGLPGQPGYEYTRPFDYFSFQVTGTSANKVESVLTHGLLLGSRYELGPDYRGVWGLYGSYDYIAPQTFRVSTTALSLGSTAQWWLRPHLALQGSLLAGLGYAAVGTTHGRIDERDYNYGVAPQALLSLRLTDDNRFSLDLAGREYFVSNVGSGTSGGRDNIVRGEASFTWRLSKLRALTFRLVANRRDARFTALGSTRQEQVTAGLFFTILGQDRFGLVDWR